jgi:hypothetical protein
MRWCCCSGRRRQHPQRDSTSSALTAPGIHHGNLGAQRPVHKMANLTTNHPGHDRDGGGEDLGGNQKGGEITRQRRALQKDSRANEVEQGRVHAPRKGSSTQECRNYAGSSQKEHARKTMASEAAGQRCRARKTD